MKFRSLTYGAMSSSCLRALFCFGVAGLLVACSSPAEKIAPADDTSTTADTAVDASDTGADTADSTSGEVTEDTAPDGADTAPDTLTDTAEPPATCDEQLGLLPSTDCGCGGQLICRDQAAAPQCVGALPENACGGCGGIAVEIGAGCGFCGDGVWTCDPANPDAPTCVGATPQNSCGGCTTLPGIEGDSCSADGFFLCVTEEELVCVGPGQNACGGFAALGEALGGPCGECGAGRFVCDGTDAVRCEDAASPRNACGGCGTLPNRVGDDCGDCDGTWACDPSNPDGLICSQTRNVCGSCGSPGAGALGEACTGGRLVCGADGQLSCESNDRNLCGGTTALSAAPGTDCGSCGGVNICAGLERVVCIGSAPVNGCGGCGFLPAFPGTFCGVDHTWECNADGTMDCARTTSSVVVSDAVGGTTVVDKGQVTVPAGAVTDPIRITIRVRNGMMIPGYQLTSPVLEFGPAGTEFAQPLEVQIISDDAPASDMVWSNRATEGGGYSEVSGATVEGDALVGDVNHFSIGFTGIPLADTELCGDGLDNDGDALADCDDSDCAAVPGCASEGVEECGNGIDDDRDLFVDCDDSDCIGEIGCGEPPVESCNDGVDNDGDLFVDCDDSECLGALICDSAGVEICGDGRDNDGDGWADCYDYDCSVAVIGGSCPQAAGGPFTCAAGTRYRREVIAVREREGGGFPYVERRGLCLPVVGEGESCGADSICGELQDLVCDAAGTCRLAVQAEACDGAVPLTSNPGSTGPDYYAVDRLDGLTAADESLNCTGTVGPEKVYFYTATSPVEVTIVVGATDSNGPAISWHARTATCGDIFSEVACGSASLEPTAGSVRLTAGQTLYVIVDSAARWAGENADAAEFFLEVNERPVADLGESCSAAACESGLTCTTSSLCAVTVCGDGDVGGLEACDDGNAVAGDGCTACTVDVYREVEPNDDVANANNVGNARIITGVSSPSRFSEYIDSFCVPLGANGGQVKIGLESSSGGVVYWEPRTVFGTLVNLTEQGSTGVLTTASSNFCFVVYGSGVSVNYSLVAWVNPGISIPEHGACGDESGVVGRCADIGGVPAVCRGREPDLLSRVGTCEISACGDGFVNGAVGESCDDGNVAAGDGCSATCLLETDAEIEPNNTTLTARNIGSFRAVSGDISASTDADHFKITLARRSHLEFEADSAVFTGVTSNLTIELLSSTGASLFSGRIDSYRGVSGARYGRLAGGTRRLLNYSELAFLEPGTYTFRVSSTNGMGAYTLFVRDIGSSVIPEGVACDPFAYLPCSGALACSLLTETCASVVCGNGDVTLGEACDDGNTADGDGCSATCTVEIISALSLPVPSTPFTTPSVGAQFSFADGSEARIYELEQFLGLGTFSFYLPIRIEGNSRVRVFNASATRFWRVDGTSPYSTLGVQVSAATSTTHPRPRWLAAAPSLRADSCDFNTSDGVCDEVADCIDCGVPYGSLTQTYDGIDTRLTPGDYLMEISLEYGRNGVIVVGESPAERAQ
jgi:cysteine-rich repeat protein